jgi:hypothetical protein
MLGYLPWHALISVYCIQQAFPSRILSKSDRDWASKRAAESLRPEYLGNSLSMSKILLLLENMFDSKLRVLENPGTEVESIFSRSAISVLEYFRGWDEFERTGEGGA